MRKQKVILTVLLIAAFLWGAAGPALASELEDYNELHRYVQWGELDSVKKFLKSKAKIVNYNKGEILLDAVGLVVDPLIVKALLDAGVNANSRQVNTDNNALHYVIEQCTEDNRGKILSIVKMLVVKGTSVNHKRANDGYTPLHIAARREAAQKEIFESLLSAKGVDVNIRCNKINEYEDGAWPAIAHVLTRANDPYGHNLAIVKMIMARGQDVKALMGDDLATRKSWTLLHLLCATSTDRADMAEVLLNSGLELEAMTKDGNMSPLHMALMANNPKICTLLLSKGASISSTNSDGVNVLAHAKGFCTDKHFESAKVVIDWAATH
jgi:ankyrin repeat protein